MQQMIASGKLQYRGGICIDLYNMAVSDGIAFTVKTTVDTSNMLFITVEK